MKTIRMVLACIPLWSASATAMQLTCELPHAQKPGAVLKILKVSAVVDGSASVWVKDTAESVFGEQERTEKVLYHSLTTIDGRPEGSKFSVVTVESRSVSKQFNWDHVFPPQTYYVDWGKAKLAQVYAPAEAAPGLPENPTAVINDRWRCKRTD